MGRKINPFAFRLSILNAFTSIWYNTNIKYINTLKQDFFIRQFIKTLFNHFFIINNIIIKRTNLNIQNYVVITIEYLTLLLQNNCNKTFTDLIFNNKFNSIFMYYCSQHIKQILKQKFNVVSIIIFDEIKTPFKQVNVITNLIANFVLKESSVSNIFESISNKLKLMKIHGAKMKITGRIRGAEKASSMDYLFGIFPRNNLFMNVQYSSYPVKTIYGVIGIKVWLYL